LYLNLRGWQVDFPELEKILVRPSISGQDQDLVDKGTGAALEAPARGRKRATARSRSVFRTARPEGGRLRAGGDGVQMAVALPRLVGIANRP
jgi:hypothetical protein